MTLLALRPAMPVQGDVDRASAIWVGAIDTRDVAGAAARLDLRGAEGFDRARLLVREGDAVRGYVTLPVHDGSVSTAALAATFDDLPHAEATPRPPAEPITVVLCTHERPDMLREALQSLAELDYPAVEVVVVDNAPRTAATHDLLTQEFPQFRYVREDRQGLSFARNAGLLAASHPLVAYTDDDVLADPSWLWGLMRGFAQSSDVACVTGVVPSGELRNAVQVYFDARVSWSKLTRARVFRLDEPPADLPMFPFCVGEFGTGANFGVRRDVMLGLGAFDTALGAGTETKGGEDLDMFARMLFAGHAICVEPSAVIWHRHRADLEALRAQAVGYGRGLGAWLTTIVLRPRMLAAAATRAPRAIARLVDKPMQTVDDAAPSAALDAELTAVGGLELRSVLSGPGAYLAARRAQWAAPDPEREGGQSGARQIAYPGFWAVLGIACATAGLVALAPLPTWLRLPLVLAFVLAGPGSILRAWVTLPPFLTAMTVPAFGVALMILVASAMAFTAVWDPGVALAATALATAAGGALTLRLRDAL